MAVSSGCGAPGIRARSGKSRAALARIRCVSIADGGAIGIPRGLIRAVLLALVIPAVISDGDGRGVHDRAAGSIVVPKS